MGYKNVRYNIFISITTMHIIERDKATLKLITALAMILLVRQLYSLLYMEIFNIFVIQNVKHLILKNFRAHVILANSTRVCTLLNLHISVCARSVLPSNRAVHARNRAILV